MCGITGYYGFRDAVPILFKGLKRLEYRGYDSAGIAIHKGSYIDVIKVKGKVDALAPLIEDKNATIGIAHSRWSTHGAPNHVNAHPHMSMDESITIVHNGIIENHSSLKKDLIEKYGFIFKSDTDSEVIAQLIQYFYEGNFEEAFRKMLTKIDGAFGIVSMHKDHEQIMCARKGSPLVLGVNTDEIFIGSDPSPFLEYTKDVVYMNEKQMAIIDEHGYRITDFNGFDLDVEIETVPFGIESIQKDGYDHFMLKEIMEQPNTIQDCFRGKIRNIDQISINVDDVKRMFIVACGTSFYSALVTKYIIEQKSHVPVSVEYASEFRYRKPMLYPSDLVIAVSQSGETADTLEAVRLAKRIGCKVAGMVNVTGSSIAKECGQGIYLHAGPEIGVASTKAFTSQITAGILLNLHLNKDPYYRHELVDDLINLPAQVKGFLETQNLEDVAEKYKDAKYFLFMGRDICYPVALEGALKLKEITYIPAEGYASGEMKHGPIALVDERVPCVFIVTKDSVYDKVISNMEEVKSRGGKIICVCDEINEDITRLSDDIIPIPKVRWEFTPIVSVLPLQLLSYYLAKALNRNIDQPRNLAKSVTVE